jgi:hypothetical protein
MKKQISGLIALSLLIISCGTNNSSEDTTSILPSSQSTPSFTITTANVNFYSDLEYGTSSRNQFDIFMPQSDKPTPLAVLIHGGAFIFGSKEQFYSQKDSKMLINDLLSQNIAVASINYSLAQQSEGVSTSLEDTQKALQFLRYHSTSFNISKEDILLLGNSAGAGAALWIGLSDNRANLNSTDSVDHESTRVKGLVLLETQASYDLFKWQDEVFSEYKNQGLTQDSILSIIGQRSLFLYAGVSSQAEFDLKNTADYQDSLNMLSLISSDDPEMYVSNVNVKFDIPSSLNDLYHHPLHAKAIMDQANKQQIKAQFNIPKMNINTLNNEGITDFIIRKLKTEQ